MCLLSAKASEGFSRDLEKGCFVPLQGLALAIDGFWGEMVSLCIDYLDSSVGDLESGLDDHILFLDNFWVGGPW